MWAGLRVGCGRAPAWVFKHTRQDAQRPPAEAPNTHLEEFLHPPNPPLAGLHQYVDAFMLDQLVDSFRGQWAASLPYPLRVLAADANGELPVLGVGESSKSPEVKGRGCSL